MASLTPSSVIGKVMTVGLIPCREANRSNSQIVRREAVSDPLMEAPRPVNSPRSMGVFSAETVNGYIVP